jgi:hypothetical protein
MDRTRTLARQLAEPDDVGRTHLRRLGFRLDRRAVQAVFPDLLRT